MDMFSAIADPTRRTIIELLVERGTLSATEISREFKMTPPAVSQHLKVLRDANLITFEKKAQQRIYQINDAKITELEEWVHKLTKQWNARLDRLEKLLEREKQGRG